MSSTILAFGYHDRASPRHTSVCASLTREGGRIIECHTEARGFIGKCGELLRKYLHLSADADTVLVPFPGHYLVPIAWLLTRYPRKRLIFDAFLSLHDTNVSDRGTVSSWHPRAWFLYGVDFISCHLADEVVIDTEAHRQFFIDTFRLRPEKIRVIYLESLPEVFTPVPERKRKKEEAFRIFFYGTYIPLQGIEHILGAAKILQDRGEHVLFTFVGGGQTLSQMKNYAEDLELRHVIFLPSVPLKQLPAFFKETDLCLGIFGTSAKASRVIPHKVYDAVASGVPVLTADSPAIRERFANNPLVILCPPGDPNAIADAILDQIASSSPHHANTAI